MTKVNYFITIAVRVYNAENYIERCAKSLFGQTYESLKFIFVDDCTPDQSIVILKNVLDRFPNRKSDVTIIHNNRNGGGAAALNTLIDNCNTDYFFLVDADDWLEINTIELFVKKQIETSADIVTGKVLRHTNSGNSELIVSDKDDRRSFILNTLGFDLRHTLWNRLIKTSLFAIGQVRAEEGTNLGEDWQVISKLAWNGQKFAHLDIITYHYDCTNINSYLYTKSKKNISRCLEQDYRSWVIVYNFFQDKNNIYREKLLESGEKLLYNYLYLVAEGSDKQAYNDVKSKLQSLSPTFFIKGGSHCSRLKRYVESYYILLRLSIPIRKWLVRLRQFGK